MKRIFVLLALLFLPLIVITPAFAKEVNHQDTVVLKPDQVVNKDYFATGESVTVSGIVNGDAYIAGGNILIDGTINGDLLATGGNIIIRGPIMHDLRVAGGNITIAAPVYGNVTVLGGNVTVTDSADIQGSFVSGAGSLHVFGPVAKEMTVGARELVLGSSVTDVLAGVGKLSLTKTASIGGNLSYYSQDQANIAQGATIVGTTDFHRREKDTVNEKTAAGFFATLVTTFTIIDLLAAFLVGLLFLYGLPHATKRITEEINASPFKNLLIGFITIIVTPVVCLLLLLTVIGIPLSFLIALWLIIALYVGKVLVAYFMSDLLAQKLGLNLHKVWVLLIGVILLLIVAWIPIIGGLAIGLAALIGLGSLLQVKKFYYTDLRSKKLL